MENLTSFSSGTPLARYSRDGGPNRKSFWLGFVLLAFSLVLLVFTIGLDRRFEDFLFGYAFLVYLAGLIWAVWGICIIVINFQKAFGADYRQTIEFFSGGFVIATAFDRQMYEWKRVVKLDTEIESGKGGSGDLNSLGDDPVGCLAVLTIGAGTGLIYWIFKRFRKEELKYKIVLELDDGAVYTFNNDYNRIGDLNYEFTKYVPKIEGRKLGWSD